MFSRAASMCAATELWMVTLVEIIFAGFFSIELQSSITDYSLTNFDTLFTSNM